MKKNRGLYQILTILVLVAVLFFIFKKCTYQNDSTSPEIVKKPSLSGFKKSVEGKVRSSENSVKIKSTTEKKVLFNKLELMKIEVSRSNSKLNLASLYTGQKAFFADMGRYTTDLKITGNTPYGKKNINMKFGYLKAYEPSELLNLGRSQEDPSFKDSDEFIFRELKNNNERYRYSKSIENVRLSDFKKYCDYGCTATEKNFEMLLVFPYPNNKGYEVWTINHNKELKQKFSLTK